MNKNQLILGVAIAAIGVVMLLANINIAFAEELVRSWWPLLLVGLGLSALWSGRGNTGWGVFLTVVGLGLLLSTLGVFDLSFGEVFLPAMIVGLGLALVAGSLTSRKVRDGETSTINSDEALWAILGGLASRSDSSDYRGGAVNAVLGGVEMDLSRVTIKQEAVIQVWVLMGGITMRVPEGVAVKQRTVNILGGVDDKTRYTDGQAPVIYIDGTVTMGGIEIKN